VFKAAKVVSTVMGENPESSGKGHEPPSGRGFLTEANGKRSAMRLMSIISLFAAIMFGLVTLLGSNAESDDAGVMITLIFIVGAFAPKAVQKFAEEELNKRK
jgi:hypothetical protein